MEISNPGGMVGLTNVDPNMADNPYLAVSTAYTANVELYPGLIVQIDGYKGLAMILVIFGDFVGCELEGPFGDNDGIHQKHRYFKCPPNCGVFVTHERVQRILNTEAPPRFRACTHDLHIGDVVMVSKQVGVGVVRHSSTHLIGCELNAPVGTCDGQHEGQRYFQVKSKHAVFVDPQSLKKIEAEDLLNKLNETVERLQEIEQDLQRGFSGRIRR